MSNPESTSPNDWKVERLDGEYFRFRVGSKSRPGKSHFVDLEESAWAGQCDCERFAFVVGVERRAGKKSECRHIRVAREACKDWLWSEIAPMISRQMNQQNTIQ